MKRLGNCSLGIKPHEKHDGCEDWKPVSEIKSGIVIGHRNLPNFVTEPIMAEDVLVEPLDGIGLDSPNPAQFPVVPVPASVEVERLRELSAKAMEGPWKDYPYAVCKDDKHGFMKELIVSLPEHRLDRGAKTSIDDANLKFIVACVNYVRSALAAAAPQSGEGKKGE